MRAEVRVAARPDTVWAVLTDYEALPGIVPNLEACERVRGAVPGRAGGKGGSTRVAPPPGRVRLRQRASAQCRFWRLEAEAVLDLEAKGVAGPLGVRELAFRLVEGDFRELAGRWVVAPLPGPTPAAPPVACLLRYELDVVPRWPVPHAIVAAVVAAGLPANVAAIAAAAEAAEAASAALPGLAAAGVGGADTAPLPLPPPAGPWGEEGEGGGAGAGAGAGAAAQAPLPPMVRLPSKGPPRLQAAPWPTVRLQAAALGRAIGLGAPRGGAAPSTPAAAARLGASDYLGVSSVPLPSGGGAAATAGGGGPPDAAGTISVDAGALASVDLAAAQERRAAAARVAALYPAFGGGAAATAFPGSTTAAAAAAAPPGWRPGWRPPTVHVRRLDTAAGGLHRRAVAEVWIAAPPADVWAVLTDYERLADIVPGLVASDVLSTASPSSAAASTPIVTRLRQVGYKRMTYVELHAEAVLDVVARVREGDGGRDGTGDRTSSEPSRELQFRAVAGDFDLLRGKFMVEPGNGGGHDDDDDDDDDEEDGTGRPAGSPPSSLPPTTTLLRYAVEVKAARASPVLGLLEPWLEAGVVEDVPAALGAVGRAAEARAAGRELAAGGGGSSLSEGEEDDEEDGEDGDARLDAAASAAAAARVAERWRRPRLADMAENFAVLAAELDRCFGGGGGGGGGSGSGYARATRASSSTTPTMPGRAALRAAGRSDLEKAIAAHGGSGAVAARLGWAPVQVKGRKPNGYWDDDATVAAEMASFIAEHGLPPGTMPLRSEFTRAARWDIARAAERRGGLYALAQAIGYEMPTRASSGEWAAHVSAVAAATGLSGTNGLFERAAATYRPTWGGGNAGVAAAAAAPSRSPEGEEESSSSSDEEGRAVRRRAATAGLAALDSEVDAVALGPALNGSAAPASKAAAAPQGLRDEIDAW